VCNRIKILSILTNQEEGLAPALGICEQIYVTNSAAWVF
jgi:hypothetical protein